MGRFAHNIIKLRIPIVILTILVTVILGFGITRIRINSDILSYLKRDEPVVKLFNRIGEEYSGNFIVMVGVETDEVFSTRCLEIVRDLTESYKEVDGVTAVISLTDILDLRRTEGGLEVSRLIDKDDIPQTQEALDRLKRYALSKELYRGRIVSDDSRITLIVCRVSHEANRVEVAKRIKAITESIAPKDFKTYFSGIPVQIGEMHSFILKDVIKLTPIVSIVIVLILALSFRSAMGVLLPLVGVMISTIWVVGLMGWLGVRLSLVSNITPVVLIAVGSAYGIHYVSKYREDMTSNSNRREISVKALSKVVVPITLAGLTTLIGFLSFIGSYLTAISEFGIFTAIGVAFALLIAITFVPAICSFGRNNEGVYREAKRSSEGILLQKIAVFVLKRKWFIFASVMGISVLSIVGLPLIERAIDFLEYFPKQSGVRRSEQMMRARFGGSTPIQIVVKGDIKDPFVLKKIHKLEKFINSLPNISNTQSIASLISEMNNVMNDRFCIPDTKEGVANLWFFIEGESIMEQLVNKDCTEALIQARLATENTKKALMLVKQIDHYINRTDELNTVVKVPYFKPKEKLLQWIYEDITQSIYCDILSRMENYKVDKETLKEHVKQAVESSQSLNDPKACEYLRRGLKEYFEEEFELFNVSSWSLDHLISSVLQSFKNETFGNGDLLKLLKEFVIQEGLQVSFQDLEGMIEALTGRILEIYGNLRVENMISKLMPLFPLGLQSNKDFINDIKGDLWLINERAWIVPQELSDGNGYQIEFEVIQSGIPKVYELIDKNILKNQFQSLLLAIIVVFVMLWLQFRSFKLGLISILPIIFTVLVNFAVMAYFKVSLDIATLIIGGISVGIGIDYSIHFMNRLYSELLNGRSETDAVVRTITTTGRAILVNAASVALGFSILLLSQLSPIRRFGWMMAVTMLFSSISAITFLPSVILISKVRLLKGLNSKR